MKTVVDLNCDMGEGFGHWVLSEAPDEEIMKVISSANVAAGFHAGDPGSIDRVAALCQKYGVGFGVHPGYNDLQGFGRRFIAMDVQELINDITYQIGAMREFGRKHKITLQHVKLHGALYMEAAKNAELSRLLIDLLSTIAPGGKVYCMADSETEKAANKAGYQAVREFYADRDYEASGSIVFARKVNELDPDAVAKKCLQACMDGTVKTVEGQTISVPFESICFHSDTPGALRIGIAIRNALTEQGIRITSPI